MDAAVRGAELVVGDEPGRIYYVESMGSFEDNPNLTDKKFSGNPTRSYHTQQTLRVVGEWRTGKDTLWRRSSLMTLGEE